MLGPPETAWSERERSRTMSVTAALGFPGRRRGRRPEGFRAARCRPGRQRRSAIGGRGVFTTNRVVAAPVVWTREVLKTRELEGRCAQPGEPTPALT